MKSKNTLFSIILLFSTQVYASNYDFTDKVDENYRNKVKHEDYGKIFIYFNRNPHVDLTEHEAILRFGEDDIRHLSCFGENIKNSHSFVYSWANPYYLDELIHVDIVNKDKQIIAKGYYNRPIQEDIYNIHVSLDYKEKNNYDGISVKVGVNRNLHTDSCSFEYDMEEDSRSITRWVTTTNRVEKVSKSAFEEIKRDFTLAKGQDLCMQVARKYAVYPPLSKVFFKSERNPFVLTSLHSIAEYDSCADDYIPEKKKNFLVPIKGGILRVSDRETSPLRHKGKDGILSNYKGIWALDEKGRFHANHEYFFHHSLLCNKFDSRKIYGLYGQPVACAGEFETDAFGKIKSINNESGHYRPNEDQLLLVAFYLDRLNVFSEDARIKAFKEIIIDNNGQRKGIDSIIYTPETLRSMDTNSILGKYRFLREM